MVAQLYAETGKLLNLSLDAEQTDPIAVPSDQLEKFYAIVTGNSVGPVPGPNTLHLFTLYL